MTFIYLFTSFCREAKIAAKLETMDETITSHKDKRREIQTTLMDSLLLTPKQIRAKAKAT